MQELTWANSVQESPSQDKAFKQKSVEKGSRTQNENLVFLKIKLNKRLKFQYKLFQ